MVARWIIIHLLYDNAGVAKQHGQQNLLENKVGYGVMEYSSFKN